MHLPSEAPLDLDALSEPALRAALEDWASDIDPDGQPLSEFEVLQRTRSVEFDELLLERAPP